MHFHLLKDTPHILPRPAVAGPASPRRAAPLPFIPDWRAAFGRIARRWIRNRSVATLNAMDDRLLSDIGLRRSDIRLYVAEIDMSDSHTAR